MTLSPGARIGTYEIRAAIGAGGMGEVYRATDTRLRRDVAIKILPEGLARDEERLARFEREARLLAQLNHPNIATLHGLEEHDGRQVLVMELVEGETLAERIAQRALSIEEALPLFTGIAEGLEAAHQRGIVHRDLKPSNIKITTGGKPKILDFGLAKAMAAKTRAQDLSQSPTLTRDGTQVGVLLGTAPYMSPEQARGKAVDKRTDIWAFGCCLYEALTGRVAFLGETVSDTIGRILHDEPDWDAFPTATPAPVRRALRRCLSKDSGKRIHDIADARIELEEALHEPIMQATPSNRRASLIPWIVAALGVLVAGVSFLVPRQSGTTPPVVMRSSFDLPAGLELSPVNHRVLELSPDGTHLVYRATEGDTMQLYLRPLNEDESTPIPGSENAGAIAFSPDGHWVAFLSLLNGAIKKVQLDGEGAAIVCDFCANRGGVDWTVDDSIVFVGESGLMRVPATGGTPSVLTRLDPDDGEQFHYYPDVLPNGKGVIYTIVKSPIYEEASIVVESFERPGERRLLARGAVGRYVPSGHFVYAREDSLYAAPFDLDRLELSGTGIPVQTHVAMMPNGVTHFAVSDSGTLVYLPRAPMDRRLVLVDRQGGVQALDAPTLPYLKVRTSPDGTRIALQVRGTSESYSEIHIYELAQARMQLVASRFEGASGEVFRPSWGSPVWSPDGSRLAINAAAPGGWVELFLISADGSESAQQLTESLFGWQTPGAWSPDGERLLFAQNPRSPTGWGIFEMSLADRTSRVLVDPEGRQAQPALSPDGRWIAYQAFESGRQEIYITPYARSGAHHKVSIGGGTSPLWAKDGRTLFYQSDARMMAADITTAPVTIGVPRVLFERPHLLREEGTNGRTYDLAPDGERFVMIETAGEGRPTELRVVLNWFSELERLVPTDL